VKVVAFGGGTGLPRVLKALKLLNLRPVAVVNVVDDGGSSGRIRKEFEVLPPGDLRNSLVALSEETLLSQIFQYRFKKGEGLSGHTIGNLILTALFENGVIEGLAKAHSLLQVKGRVLPSTLSDVKLLAWNKGGEEIRGQARIAQTEGITKVSLEPSKAKVYSLVMQEVREADLILIAPGSLYTSIIPTLLPCGLERAISESSALKVYLGNIANLLPETRGYTASQCLEAIYNHISLPKFDILLFDRSYTGKERIFVDEKVERFGKEVRFADLSDEDARHSPEKLQNVLGELLKECHLARS
jgi:uncharacterized cofD-like protein